MLEKFAYHIITEKPSLWPAPIPRPACGPCQWQSAPAWHWVTQASSSFQPQSRRPHHPLPCRRSHGLRDQPSPLNVTHSSWKPKHSRKHWLIHVQMLQTHFLTDWHPEDLHSVWLLLGPNSTPQNPHLLKSGYLFSSIIFSISSDVTFLKASDGLWRASYSAGERTSYRSRI